MQSPTYEIVYRERGDGIVCYFFLVDGKVRYSSYGREEIIGFAEGYCHLTLEPTEARRALEFFE